MSSCPLPLHDTPAARRSGILPRRVQKPGAKANHGVFRCPCNSGFELLHGHRFGQMLREAGPRIHLPEMILFRRITRRGKRGFARYGQRVKTYPVRSYERACPEGVVDVVVVLYV